MTFKQVALVACMLFTTSITLCPPRSEGKEAFRKSLEEKRAKRKKDKAKLIHCDNCDYLNFEKKWFPATALAITSKRVVAKLLEAKKTGFLKFAKDQGSQELGSNIEMKLANTNFFLEQVEELPAQELEGKIQPFSNKDMERLMATIESNMKSFNKLVGKIWAPNEIRKALFVVCTVQKDGALSLAHVYLEE